MPAPEVTAYVQRLRAAGYTSGQIRDALIRSGIAPAEAAKAAGTSKWLLFAAGGAGGAFVLVVLLLALLSGPSFTITTQTGAAEITAGSTLTFSDTFSFERDVGPSITLTHELVAPTTGNVVATTTQVVNAIQTAKSTVKVPADIPPGRYIVRTTAEADGHTAESSFAVKIVPKSAPAPTYTSTPSEMETSPSPAPTTPASCDDFDSCTVDTIKDSQCTHTLMPVCCGDYVCDSDNGETTGNCARDCAPLPESKTSAEIIADAESIAGYNVASAEQSCATLAQVTDADQCYDTVARKALSSSTCIKIGMDKQRDSCLLYFAINQKEFSVCEQMTNPNLQASCYSFRNLAGLSQESQ